MAKKGKLTTRQERFWQEYVISLNATQAYKKVYKCSYRVANIRGPKLLVNVSIQARLQALRKKIEIKTGVTAERVINELAKVGFSNIQDFISGDDNKITDISQLKREVAAAVESIQVDIRHDGGDSEGYTEKVKLKLHSKLNALSDLGRHLGIFEKDNKQKNVELKPIITYEEVARRMKAEKSIGTGLDVRSIDGGDNGKS